MTGDDHAARPLLVPTAPYREEGLHGLIARATHSNRLGHAKVILEDIGLSLARQGLASQRMDDRQAIALALKIGCEAEAIGRIRTQPVQGSQGPLLRWGSTAIRSSDLLVMKRRVCPETMTSQDWLPAQWSLKHRPYCAYCFAPLVDRCDTCGLQLGWGTARGVAACAACKREVEASSAPRLSEIHREDYRLLSDISSMDDNIRKAGLSQFPARIASLELHQFLDLALGLGQAFIPNSGGLRRIATKLPSRITSSAYCTGVRILKDWPQALIERGEAFIAEGKMQEMHFWQTLTRLRNAGTNGSFAGTFLRSQLPGLTDERRLSIPGLFCGVMGSRELQNASGLQVPQIRRLREDGVFGKVHATGTKAKSFQIDRKIGEEVTRLFRDTVSLHAAAYRIGVPVYCVEQLVCLGELQAVDHAALISLSSAPRIMSNSLEDFLKRIANRIPVEQDGRDGCISLRAACSALYCGEKPYAKYLVMVLAGSLGAHLRQDEHKRSAALLSRILVNFAAFEQRPTSPFVSTMYPSFRFSDTYTQRDAADVLSVRSIDVAKATEEELLVSKTGYKCSRIYERSTIRSAAERHMSSAELAYRTGWRSRSSAAEWARCHDLARASLGWPRQDTLQAIQNSGAAARSL